MGILAKHLVALSDHSGWLFYRNCTHVLMTDETWLVGYFLWFQFFLSSSHSLVHLSCVNAAIAVLVVHPEHQTQLLLGTPVGSHVDHLESNNVDINQYQREKIP